MNHNISPRDMLGLTFFHGGKIYGDVNWQLMTGWRIIGCVCLYVSVSVFDWVFVFDSLWQQFFNFPWSGSQLSKLLSVQSRQITLWVFVPLLSQHHGSGTIRDLWVQCVQFASGLLHCTVTGGIKAPIRGLGVATENVFLGRPPPAHYAKTFYLQEFCSNYAELLFPRANPFLAISPLYSNSHPLDLLKASAELASMKAKYTKSC